jgi:hypothetical protein
MPTLTSAQTTQPTPGGLSSTGDNGSGKTALLRAIALAILGPDQSLGLNPDLRGWVTSGQFRGTVSVEIRPMVAASDVDAQSRRTEIRALFP